MTTRTIFLLLLLAGFAGMGCANNDTFSDDMTYADEIYDQGGAGSMSTADDAPRGIRFSRYV